MYFIKKVSEPWFGYIKEGKKTSEGGLNKGDWAEMKYGDIIKFYNDCFYLEVFIVDIRHYETVEDMITNERLENILPGITKVNEGVKIYEEAPINFTKEKQEKYGMVAVEVRI